MPLGSRVLQGESTDMSKKEKPLPKPPNTPFGRKKQFGKGKEQDALIADRMAAAMAEGKLEEFLKQEMPDNEYARNLATMMMGMSGMMPSGSHMPAPPSGKGQQPVSLESTTSGQTPSTEEIPEDARAAIQGGDVKGLMDILRREHQKRMPKGESETKTAEEAAVPTPLALDRPAIDKELIDELIQIAKDNSVTMDWMILRAIKLYVQEYQKTGKL